MPIHNTPPTKVQTLEIDADNDGQRIDNFLMSKLKGLPKSRIYKILRSGEVRVNKGRIKPSHRLVSGDLVRIPPVRLVENKHPDIPDRFFEELNETILFENDDLIIINKPSGLAVHAGSNIAFGVIDILRADRFENKFIELVHRLDRQTSGCLVLAKSRIALTQLNALFNSNHDINKQYLTLTKGNWPESEHRIDTPLSKNEIKGGERMVTVNPQGKTAISIFRPVEQFNNCSLVEVTLLTGRTHQIRVHAASENHPVAGDEKYGDKAFNKSMKSKGLNRMFLHARHLAFNLNGPIQVTAPLEGTLKNIIETLRNNEESI
ncbi:MAG: RluA family pseudouridine synthase [Gammaproteobacteria bacterium]|nr:RluA family pseudouridine synthase [Gammaproteobacteria bacterium]